VCNKKICPICGKEFEYKSRKKTYCSKKCQTSKINRQKEHRTSRANPVRRCQLLCSMAKNRAKSGSIPFDLTPEYVFSLWENQNGKCLLTGNFFELVSNVGVVPNAPSIDRIIPALGYVQGNIRLVTYHMNVALSEFGVECFEQLIENYVNNKKDRSNNE